MIFSLFSFVDTLQYQSNSVSFSNEISPDLKYYSALSIMDNNLFQIVTGKSLILNGKVILTGVIQVYLYNAGSTRLRKSFWLFLVRTIIWYHWRSWVREIVKVSGIASGIIEDGSQDPSIQVCFYLQFYEKSCLLNFRSQ